MLLDMDSDGSNGAAAPDENYAREILQLFTIGLWDLDEEGVETDTPTYTQENIKELARVFTGFHAYGRPFGDSYPGSIGVQEHISYQVPMLIDSDKHDKGAKALDFLGELSPLFNSGDSEDVKEVKEVINRIYNHENVPFFVSKRLIQHFVTSNPSQAYVKRVAAVFRNNRYEDDQLAHVIKAILLDPEARNWDNYLTNPSFGKLRSPILRTCQIAKALNAGKRTDEVGKVAERYFPAPWEDGFSVTRDIQWFGVKNDGLTKQHPLNSPSVFNFFEPTYTAPEFVTSPSFVSPEFQILDSVTALGTPNHLFRYVSEEGQVLGEELYQDNDPYVGNHTRREVIGFPYSVSNSTSYNGFTRFDNNLLNSSEVVARRFVSDPNGALALSLDPTSQTDRGIAIDRFLDEINLLFAHGRLSASTREEIRSKLNEAMSQSNMSDAYFLNTLGIQIAVTTADVAILK